MCRVIRISTSPARWRRNSANKRPVALVGFPFLLPSVRKLFRAIASGSDVGDSQRIAFGDAVAATQSWASPTENDRSETRQDF